MFQIRAANTALFFSLNWSLLTFSLWAISRQGNKSALTCELTRTQNWRFLQGNCLSSAPVAVGEHTAISRRIVLSSHFPQDVLCAAAIPLPQIYLLQADPLPPSCYSWEDLARFMLADHIVLRLGMQEFYSSEVQKGLIYCNTCIVWEWCRMHSSCLILNVQKM